MQEGKEYMISDFIGRPWRPSLRFIDMSQEAWEVIEKTLRPRQDWQRSIESNI
jgi:hypothetical protein